MCIRDRSNYHFVQCKLGLAVDIPCLEYSCQRSICSICCPVSYTHLDVYKRQSSVARNHRSQHPRTNTKKGGPLEIIRQVDEAVGAFDEVVISAVDAYSRMKPGFTPYNQRIPEEASLLTRERNRFRRNTDRTFGRLQRPLDTLSLIHIYCV